MKKKQTNLVYYMFALLQIILFPLIVLGMYSVTIYIRNQIPIFFKEYGRDDTVKMLTLGGIFGILRILRGPEKQESNEK